MAALLQATGTLRIHRSIAGTSRRRFAGRIRRIRMVTSRHQPRSVLFIIFRMSARFLNVLGLGADYVRDALRELTAGRSAFLTNIALTEKAIKNAGLALSLRRRADCYWIRKLKE